MILAFYKVSNSKEYERHTFDDKRPETIIDMLNELGDEEYRMYDTNAYGYGSVQPCPNLADFEDDYNNEDLDGGWWCIVINLKSDQT